MSSISVPLTKCVENSTTTSWICPQYVVIHRLPHITINNQEPKWIWHRFAHWPQGAIYHFNPFAGFLFQRRPKLRPKPCDCGTFVREAKGSIQNMHYCKWHLANNIIIIHSCALLLFGWAAFRLQPCLEEIQRDLPVRLHVLSSTEPIWQRITTATRAYQ